MLGILVAIGLGLIAGTITGLIPGVHINLVGAILISISAFLLDITTPVLLVIFIVSMTITHSFLDFIPSIYFGAPEEDSVLSILPGHELLNQGKGYEAVMLTNYGSLIAIFVILIISPLLILVLPYLQSNLLIAIPYLLIISSIFLIIGEREKVSALIVFLLSGFLGVAVLNMPPNQPFLPMLSGLFGASSLIICIKSRTKIAPQKISDLKPERKIFLKPLVASSISSPLCTFLPGLGGGQSAVIASSISKIKDNKQFLVLLGMTNTLILGFSFVIFYRLGKTRAGIISAVDFLVSNISFNLLVIIMLTILLTGIISFYLTKFLAIYFSKVVEKVNYQLVSFCIIIFLTIIIFLISGIVGFIVFLVSTVVGLFGILSNVRRINLMGCLMIPTIMWYLFS